MENVGELVATQKAMATLLPNQPVQAVQQDPPLVHKIVLANIDRMLQKLPPDIVEDLCFEFSTTVYNKIKEYNNK